MIGYINRTRDNQWKECTLEKFNEMVDSTRVKEIIADVRRGKVERKRELPAFIFGGMLDVELYKKYVAECEQRGEKTRGSRCEEFLKPTGMFMMDFDRTEGNPRDLYEKFLRTMKEHGIDFRKILVAAHGTAKGYGTRLVLVGRPGSTIEADQKWISELMGEDIDEVCKDFSRISYCPSREDIFYLNEEMLFGKPFEGIYDSKLTIHNSQMTISHADENYPLSTINYPLKSRASALDASLVVKAMEEQLGGAPKHGGRNQFIFAMACHLKHLYGNDPQTLCAIVPNYGERIDRWRSTLESACKSFKNENKVPDVVLRALKVAERRQQGLQAGETEEGEDNEPLMPPKMPPLIAHLTCKVPGIYKPAVAMSVFPALGAHLGGVTFRYIDNVVHSATFMNVLMAKMSSGKSCVNKPIEYIVADIVERDNESRRKEQEWKNKVNSKGANKEKPQRPEDICVQVLVPDMTNAAFVQRLADAKGKFLYTQMDEIELLDQLKTSTRGQQVSQIIRLAYDCGEYGQERVGSQSVTAKVRVKWNWNASTTILKGQDYFHKALLDGTLSRLTFCTIKSVRGSELPVIGTYDEEFAEILKPYIDHLNEARGEIKCPEARKFVRKLLHEAEDMAALSDDEGYEVLSYRALVSAYLRAMVLYVAHGCEWSKEIEDFSRWSFKYDMWCKMAFFGEKMVTDLRRENFIRKRGPKNLLEMLPDKFTEQDVVDVRLSNGKDANAKQMISNWLFRRLICLSNESNGFSKVG